MDKDILSSNKSHHECVFKDMSTIVNVCFQKTDILLLSLNIHSPKELFLFLLEICLNELGILVPVLKDSFMPDQLYPLKQHYSLIY